MATNVNVSSSFDGTAHKELFVQLFKKAETIDKGLISLLPNVLGVIKLPKLTYSASFAPASCGWNPNSTINLTEKELTVKKFQLQDEICKDEFAHTFQAQQYGMFSAHAEIPTNIKEAILLQILNVASLGIDNYIWNSTTTGLFDQFEADTEVPKIAGVVITPQNVVAELDKVYQALVPEMDGEPDVKMVVSRNVMKAYKSAQASMNGNTTVGDKSPDYMGQILESVSNYPANTIAAYRVSNVYFGFGIESDSTNIRISDDESRLDGNVRYDLKTSMGQTYVWGGEIVYYRTV